MVCGWSFCTELLVRLSDAGRGRRAPLGPRYTSCSVAAAILRINLLFNPKREPRGRLLEVEDRRADQLMSN